uniref:Uncharacterized protein n=1 Tax=Arundo donax TaxID=35708 RepID=A0A0A8XSP5_ARUDO
MGRRVCVSLLVLLGVVLALAGPVAGGMKATFIAGSPGSWSADAAALRRLMSARLEDGVAPELTVDLELHRRVLAGSIRPPVLNRDRPACLGSCAGRGRPYTGRDCKSLYQCPH